MSRLQIEAEVGDIVAEELAKQNEALNQAERKQLVGDILDELLGLGPLEPLLKDPTITDILVNGHDQVFVERYGVLEPSPVAVQGREAPSSDHPEDRLGSWAADRRIFTDGRRTPRRRKPRQCGRPATRARWLSPFDPQVRARSDQHGPAGRDRKRSAASRRSPQAIVGSRRNVLISGGTGSGKTTLLNAMSAFIDGRERIVTIEDSAELQMQQEHVVRLETRPPNIEGRGEVAQRDLVKNALRMRPDRIILGEVRAGEAFDMLQAMNTGHDGSMTTVHANTTRDALSRVEQMIGMSGIDIPAKSSRAQIASAIHVVVQVARLADGRRKVVSVSELTGMEGDVITMQEIFRFRQTGVSNDGIVQGRFEATGIRPRFLDQMMSHGITLSADLFRPDAKFEVMSPIWIRALVLICTFGAVVLVAETLIRAYASTRTEGRAINLRLSLIGRGRTTSETMNLLRRTASSVPEGLPPFLDRIAHNFERLLMQAQLTIPTGQLMLAF